MLTLGRWGPCDFEFDFDLWASRGGDVDFDFDFDFGVSRGGDFVFDLTSGSREVAI